MGARVVTTLDLATEWRCSCKTIYRMVKAGTLTPLELGKRPYKFDYAIATSQIRNRRGLKL